MNAEIPEGWTAHDRGECPVPPGSRPDMIFAMSGTRATLPYYWTSLARISDKNWQASHANWSNCIAYRTEQQP